MGDEQRRVCGHTHRDRHFAGAPALDRSVLRRLLLVYLALPIVLASSPSVSPPLSRPWLAPKKRQWSGRTRRLWASSDRSVLVRDVAAA